MVERDDLRNSMCWRGCRAPSPDVPISQRNSYSSVAGAISRFNVFPALKGRDFRSVEGDVPPRSKDVQRGIRIAIVQNTTARTYPTSHSEIFQPSRAAGCVNHLIAELNRRRVYREGLWWTDRNSRFQ